MALDAKVLTFTANTGTGTQDLTGTTFTPKAAVVWWSRATNADATFAEHSNMGMGFTDGTNSRSVNVTSEDNQPTMDSASVASTSLITVLNLTGTLITIDAQASFSTWLSNGMQINWSNAPAAAFKFHVLFLGGTDITNVNVGSFTLPNAAGNQDVVTGFVPDTVLFLCGAQDLLFNATGRVDANLVFGAATDSSNQWTQYTTWEEGPSVSDNWQYYSHSLCLATMTESTGAPLCYASYVGANSPTNTGFRINWTGTLTGNDGAAAYLAIKGGNFAVGNNTEPANTGDQQITTNKDAKAVMLFGLNTSTAGSVQTDSMVTVGAGTSSSEMVSVATHTTDNVQDAVNVSVYDAGAIYLNITANATASSSTFDDEASLASVSSTGFTLNWSNIGNARPYRYVTFGSSAGGGELKYGTISETSVSVSESLARLQTRKFTISEPSVSVSETLVRIQYLIKTLSEPSITVSETLARIATYVKPISETAITTNDSIVRLFLPRRTISEPSVSTNDSIARWISIIKQITTEPEVSIPLETLEKVVTYPRPIADTPTLSISETLERIRSSLRAISDTPTIDISELLAKSALFPKPISDTPTVSVSEILARWQSIIKQITTEPEVSISELIAGNFLISKIIEESPSISVSETLERIQTALRSISDTPEIIISELLTGLIPVIIKNISEPSVTTDPTTVERLATFLRSITVAEEPLIDVSDIVASILSYLRNITNEPEITTSDVASILAFMTRTLSEPSTNISEEITRLQSILKEIVESPIIDTSDSAIALKLQTILLLESRIKWYYSLLTRKIPEGEV